MSGPGDGAAGGEAWVPPGDEERRPVADRAPAADEDVVPDPGATGDDADDADEQPGFLRRIIADLSPQGPVQTAIGVLALCFLAGAVGYLVGTRQSPVPTSALDQGFLFDMMDHHDQAVGMALCTVNRAQDQVVQSMANDVLVFQNRELARMGSLLEQMQVERPAAEGRTAMEWMGMPTPVESMPGMASDADYQALCSAEGREVDRRFLTLMSAHHLGGVHMAEVAAEQAANPRVRELARVMARNQTIEVNEYQAQMKRLGFT